MRRLECIGSACRSGVEVAFTPWHADPLAVQDFGETRRRIFKQPGQKGEDFREAKPQHPPGLTTAAERLLERRNDHSSGPDDPTTEHHPAEGQDTSENPGEVGESGRSVRSSGPSAPAVRCGPSASAQPHDGPPRHTSIHPPERRLTHSTPSRAARRRSFRFITHHRPADLATAAAISGQSASTSIPKTFANSARCAYAPDREMIPDPISGSSPPNECQSIQ